MGWIWFWNPGLCGIYCLTHDENWHYLLNFWEDLCFLTWSFIGSCSQFMLPQTERMKTSRKVAEFLYGGANQVLWNSRFGNQGANNIVNLWLPDAMIQWSCTEFNSNTNSLYNQYFCIIVATLKNSHQIVYLLTLGLGHSNELLTMPNSRLIRTWGRLVEKKMIYGYLKMIYH